MDETNKAKVMYREDFNAGDNKNWLKWIIVEKGKDGEMRFTTEDIPFEKYRFRPGT
jgi:succinate dehydrogenase / fumarate reductase flavoprotein subunit